MTVTTGEAALQLESIASSRPKPGIHPGWAVLGVATAAVFMSAPGQSYSVAAFLERMLTDLKLSRTQFSTAYCVATLVGGCTLPFVGRLVDRHGARRMLPIIATLLGLACLWMSTIHTVLALFVGFTFIRCLGQGSLSLISGWMIGERFDKRRGLAMGIVALGGTLSVMFFPQLNNLMIAELGWRTAWVILGAAVVLILVIPPLVVLRKCAEDAGLASAEESPVSTTEDRSAETDNPSPLKQHSVSEFDRSWTVAEAVRSASFWKIVAVISTGSMVGTGLIFHTVSLLGARGVTTSQALQLLAFQAAVGTVVSVFAGYLTDRVETRYLLATSMFSFGLAVLLLLVMPSPEWAILYAALLGVHGGIMRSTGTVVWVNYYGRLHQGAVRGIAMSITILAAALGPLPLAIAKDSLGTFEAALMCFLVFPVIAIFLAWTAHQPKHLGAERDVCAEPREFERSKPQQRKRGETNRLVG